MVGCEVDGREDGRSDGIYWREAVLFSVRIHTCDSSSCTVVFIARTPLYNQRLMYIYLTRYHKRHLIFSSYRSPVSMQHSRKDNGVSDSGISGFEV
jgi:hypothetical protein